jgi:hypothetical protein
MSLSTSEVRELIVRLVEKEGGRTVAELAEEIGEEKGRVNAQLNALVSDGFLENSGETRSSGPGRAPAIWQRTRKAYEPGVRDPESEEADDEPTAPIRRRRKNEKATSPKQRSAGRENRVGQRRPARRGGRKSKAAQALEEIAEETLDRLVDQVIDQAIRGALEELFADAEAIPARLGEALGRGPEFYLEHYEVAPLEGDDEEAA